MVIMVEIGNYDRQSVVDKRAYSTSYTKKHSKKMNITENLIMSYNDHIIKFSNERIYTKEYLDL